jgi:(S)-2-hydroxyglutarate dehydrogenase
MNLWLEKNRRYLSSSPRNTQQYRSIWIHLCLAAIHCLKDGSIDYGVVTKELMEDAKRFGCKLVTGSKVIRIVRKDHRRGEDGIVLYTTNGKNYVTKYLINAAGGNAVDIAHSMKVAGEYTDLHFRGEYWQAPPEYRSLTKLSIYTVPKYPEYPFLRSSLDNSC